MAMGSSFAWSCSAGVDVCRRAVAGDDSIRDSAPGGLSRTTKTTTKASKPSNSNHMIVDKTRNDADCKNEYSYGLGELGSCIFTLTELRQ